MAFVNGQVPYADMVTIDNFVSLDSDNVTVATGSNLMMPTPAKQLTLLQAAFLTEFKKPLLVSEAYRRLERQEALYAAYLHGSGVLAAVPGTSNHGLGHAADLASNVEVFGSPEHEWVFGKLASYGFGTDAPSEAWHITYVGGETITSGSTITASTGTETLLSDTPSIPKDSDTMLSFIKTIDSSSSPVGIVAGMYFIIDHSNRTIRKINTDTADFERKLIEAELKDRGLNKGIPTEPWFGMHGQWVWDFVNNKGTNFKRIAW